MAPKDEDDIYNLLTKEVMTEKVSKDILERDEIGQRMFVEFATERLTVGRLCAWDKMTKKKLKTFKTSNATVEISAGGKLVNIKEERDLLQRLIVFSRRRLQLDMKECIGTYISFWCSTTVSICVRWDSPVGLCQSQYTQPS